MSTTLTFEQLKKLVTIRFISVSLYQQKAYIQRLSAFFQESDEAILRNCNTFHLMGFCS